MTVKTSDILEFQRNSAAIKTNGLLSVLAYLLLDENRLTKNNLAAFVTQQIETDNKEKVLIDEKELFSFASFTDDEVFNVELSGVNIILKDKSTETSHPACFDDFPLNDESTSQTGIILNEDVLQSLAIACNFLADEEIQTFRSYIFVGDSHIVASDGFVGYFKRNDTIKNHIVVSRDCAQAISKLKTVIFTENDSYTFYESDKLFYAFSKREIKYLNLSSFARLDTEESFIINRNDFIKFNDMCQASVIRIPTASFKAIDKSVLQIKLDANAFDIKKEKNILYAGAATPDASFGFNPINMNRILKSMIEDKLHFYKGDHRYFIVDKRNNIVTMILQVENIQVK